MADQAVMRSETTAEALFSPASALFSAFLGTGSDDPAGYGAAFGQLLVPGILAALLAARARSA
ncbi:hypothetical protein [Streptomyces sp. NPDC057582]|uniref:hypothetical protein n=1 Tax=unclassified Streptomyces TaxID=2593676 RepID=UPI0036A75B10